MSRYAEQHSKAGLDDQYELTGSIIEEYRLNETLQINQKLDQKIASRPNQLPFAVYFTLFFSFGERFFYNSIKPVIFLFLVKKVGLTFPVAKAHFHAWLSLSNLFPIIGAAIADSYFGKFTTIVGLTTIYLCGAFLLSLFSINDLLYDYNPDYPLWPIVLALYLIAIGSGGIKPVITSHGGDQFPPSHNHMLQTYFLAFVWVVNLGALISGIFSPLLVKHLHCFGGKCYFAPFLTSSLVLSICFVVFLVGFKLYRVVNPLGEFLPGKAIKTAWGARKLWRKATEEERKLIGHWLNFADDLVGVSFTEEIRLLFKTAKIFIPYILYFFMYDQSFSEWLLQFQHMDRSIGSFVIPAELSPYINTIFLIIFIPLSDYIFSKLEKRRITFKLLDKMAIGFFFILLSFLASNILQIFQDKNFVDRGLSIPDVSDNYDNDFVCTGCLHWSLQIPQWILLSIGEAISGPAGFEFAYSQVGTQMKAFSTSIFLLANCFGNILVSIFEAIFFQVGHQIRIWFYLGLSTCGFIYLLYLKCGYIYKEDEIEDISGFGDTEYDDDFSSSDVTGS